MDELGGDWFVTWGISGGGPYALACAALLPDRVAAVASLGGVAPFDADGLSYFREMGANNFVEFGLTMAGREHLVPFCAAAEEMSAAAPEGVIEVIATLVSPPDQAVLSGAIVQGDPGPEPRPVARCPPCGLHRAAVPSMAVNQAGQAIEAIRCLDQEAVVARLSRSFVVGR